MKNIIKSIRIRSPTLRKLNSKSLTIGREDFQSFFYENK